MMELVAMHLKQRGALVSRALSFKSCTFELVNDVMTPFAAASLFFRGDGVFMIVGEYGDRHINERDAGTWSASTTAASRSGTYSDKP